MDKKSSLLAAYPRKEVVLPPLRPQKASRLRTSEVHVENARLPTAYASNIVSSQETMMARLQHLRQQMDRDCRQLNRMQDYLHANDVTEPRPYDCERKRDGSVRYYEVYYK